MHKRQWKKWYTIVLGVIVLLIVFRLALPWIVLKYANRTLADMDGYRGRVQDIDISLYRGAYQLDSLYLHKIDTASGVATPFFSADRIDLSVEWRALFQGALVGELALNAPKLRFTKDRAEIGEVVRDTTDFRQLLKDFMPLRVNRFEVFDGRIHYIDSSTTPVVDIALGQAYILAENLKNTTDDTEALPSTIHASAHAYEGTLTLDMKLDALAERPAFDLTAQIEGANLPEMNSFFTAYGKFDVSQGIFGLYSEFAASQGKYKGYVKPIINDLKVVGVEDQDDSFWQKAKEAIVGTAGKLLENPKEDQVATRIPIEGSFGETDVFVWQAVWEVLKNAFIRALLPSVDNQIDIRSPATVDDEKKGLFERIFTPDKQQSAEEGKAGLERYDTANP